MRSVDCLALVIISIIIPAAAAFGDRVPQGARERAVRYLEDDWKVTAMQNPTFLGLDTMDVDIETAKLGQPYVLYILQGNDSRSYALSDDPDPTKYTTIRWYEFPIFAGDALLGTLRTCRNELGGEVLYADEGDYAPAGFGLVGDKVAHSVLALRQRFPDCDASVVNIQDVPMAWFVLLRDAADRLFIYSDRYDGDPLGDVATELKARARASMSHPYQ
jgi:hypothetical protein